MSAARRISFLQPFHLAVETPPSICLRPARQQNRIALVKCFEHIAAILVAYNKLLLLDGGNVVRRLDKPRQITFKTDLCMEPNSRPMFSPVFIPIPSKSLTTSGSVKASSNVILSEILGAMAYFLQKSRPWHIRQKLHEGVTKTNR